MAKLKGFAWMKLHDPTKFYKLQNIRGKKSAEKKGSGFGISKEELISRLRELAEKLGKTPSIYEVERQSRTKINCATIYQMRFGSFNNAIAIAGLIPNKQNNNDHIKIELTYEEEQVLIGSVLGDGSLTKTSRNACFREPHSKKQEEYLLWKKEILKKLSPRFIYLKKYNRVRIETKCLPILTEYHNLIYRPKRTITREVLSKVDRLALCVIYMDNGTIHKWGYIRLCTHAYSKEENKLLKEWFLLRWGIKATIYFSKQGRGNYFLYFPRDESTKLLNLIKEYAHPCMLYKFYQRPKIIRPKGLPTHILSKRYRDKNREEINRKKRLAYYQKTAHPDH